MQQNLITFSKKIQKNMTHMNYKGYQTKDRKRALVLVRVIQAMDVRIDLLCF